MYKSCQMTWASINQSTYAEDWLLQSKHLPQAYAALELRSHFLTSIGQVSKLVLMVAQQRTAWTRIWPWAYTYVKRQQICFEHIKANSVLSTATYCLWCTAHLLHYMTSIPAFSVLHVHYIISFISFSSYMLEWDKTIFPLFWLEGCSKNSLPQLLKVPS